MIYQLVETWVEPKDSLHKRRVFTLQGDTFDDILAQIDTHPQHRHNLKTNKKTSFKDDQGVTHKLYLIEIVGHH